MAPDLDDLKQKCIDITSLWSSLGRPRSGLINAEWLKCKYRYKQAIKVAMQDNDRAFNDDLFDHLCSKDDVVSGRHGGNASAQIMSNPQISSMVSVARQMF